MMTKDKLRQLTGDERLGQMRESEYLGAEDIDDGTEPVLTIAGLWYGSVTLQRGKENKDVLSFKEERVPGILQVRPLIVNSTNRKTLRIRIVRETLQVNPYITNVTQVSVSFEGSVLHLSFKLTTIYGEVTIDDCDIAL